MLIFLVSCNEAVNMNSIETIKTPSERKILMRDGLYDKAIVTYYEKDIQFISEVVESEILQINCYDVDLNSDGFEDIIVVLQSSIHSGSGGDLVNILLNNAVGIFTNLFNDNLQLFGQIPPYSLTETEFYVTEESANGFYSIVVKCDGEVVVELCYNGKTYEVKARNS